MKIEKEELRLLLLKNKNFIRYNGGTHIVSIVEVQKNLTSGYAYIINDNIYVEYCENSGSTRRYNYLRIIKIKK